MNDAKTANQSAKRVLDSWRAARREDCHENAIVRASDIRQVREVLECGITEQEFIVLARKAWKLNGVGFWSRMSRSVSSFCAHYEEIRAEVGLMAKPEREQGVPTLKQVQEYAKEKWGDEGWQGWSSSFFIYWNDPKRAWRKKDGRLVDWKVALSEQVNKWRGKN